MVFELRTNEGDARQHQVDTAGDGSKGGASTSRKMPTTEAIIASIATKRQREQLKTDAVAKHAKQYEPKPKIQHA